MLVLALPGAAHLAADLNPRHLRKIKVPAAAADYR